MGLAITYYQLKRRQSVIMDTIKELMARDRFCCETVGIKLVEAAPGYAKVKLDIEERHLNALKTVQGGCIFTLADLAIATASNSHGTAAVLINASIAYHKAVSTGVLYAEAKEESLNPKLATYQVRVTDQTGDLVASFQGTVYRKKEPLESFL
jgi:acyl-CoA thioesterase